MAMWITIILALLPLVEALIKLFLGINGSNQIPTNAVGLLDKLLSKIERLRVEVTRVGHTIPPAEVESNDK